MNLWQRYHLAPAIRRRVAILAAWLLILAATACDSQPPTPNPVIAVISRVQNGVSITAISHNTPLPASVGMGLPTGATLTTADQAAAAITFGAGQTAFLQARTAVTLLRIASDARGTTAEIQLSVGRLLAVIPGGSLEVSTTLGQVVLNGSAAVVEFAPGALGLASDVFTISCLSGGCSVNARVYSGGLGPRKQLRISNSGLTVDQARLSDADVAALLKADFSDQLVAATLTAWPIGTATPLALTPTPPATAFTTPFLTRTLAPTLSTPTPQPSAADTEALSRTATPVPTSTRRPARTARPSNTAGATPTAPTATARRDGAA